MPEYLPTFNPYAAPVFPEQNPQPVAPVPTFWSKLQETWPAHIVQTLLGAAQLPGQAWRGEIPGVSQHMDWRNYSDEPPSAAGPTKIEPGLLDAVGLGGVLPRSKVETHPMVDKATDLAGLVMGGSYAAPAMKNASGMGIKAYHGSPHDFNQFDLKKIGTGEGAQAYGHGLYFAEKESVAKGYRDALAHPTVIENYDRNNAWSILGDKLKKDGFEPHRIRSIVGDLRASFEGGGKTPSLDHAMWPAEYQPIAQAAIAKMGDKFDKLYAKPANGRMYEVDINAKPEQFLDWETLPRDQQAKLKDPKYVQELAGQGVPGVKYLDSGSRNAGTGTNNYVLFDDSIVEILKKYGVAGTAGPAATMFGGGTDARANQ